MVVNREGWELIPETKKGDNGMTLYEIEDFPDQKRGARADYLADHAKNFVAAMKANDGLSSTVASKRALLRLSMPIWAMWLSKRAGKCIGMQQQVCLKTIRKPMN